jgi:hypothetical protein
MQFAKRCAPLLPFLVLLLFAGGCVTNIGPTISERTPEELGPFPDDYRNIAKRWVEDSVPGVSRVESLSISKPRAGFADSLLTSRRFGWWSDVTFRGIDRLGVSMGRLSFSLLIREGRVVARQKRIM